MQIAKILVVDDDPTSASILTKLLQHCGYDVTFELSGEAAISSAAVRQPDVIFIDLGMPDMSGYELARQLRQQRANGKPKIVTLTGYGPGQGRGDDSLFDEYLIKPANTKVLRRVIDGTAVGPGDGGKPLDGPLDCEHNPGA